MTDAPGCAGAIGAVNRERDKPFAGACFVPRQQGGLPNKIRLFEVDKARQPRLEQVKFRQDVGFPVQEPFFHPHGLDGAGTKQPEIVRPTGGAQAR